MKIMSVSVPRLYFIPLTLVLAGHLNTIVCTAFDRSYPEDFCVFYQSMKMLKSKNNNDLYALIGEWNICLVTKQNM